jgi:hypothetical protein
MKLHLNSNEVAEALNRQGYAILPKVWPKQVCRQMIDLYDQPQHFRKTISMERYRFGAGEYKYFTYPLPGALQQLREALYQIIYPVANSWSKALQLGLQYPATHSEFLAFCQRQQQTLATPLLLKYGPGGYNTLHQDLYGDVYFPFQAVVFLNEPGSDYTGGEFVLTQQIPRAQSKAQVLQPNQGDVLIFTTRFRAQQGTKGYYRVNVKHGVSEVHTGERHTLGVIFHDGEG